jgi:hypothetical protein
LYAVKKETSPPMREMSIRPIAFIKKTHI